MVTLQWASIERGRCRAVRRQKNTQATRGGIAVRARPSAPTTHYLYPLFPPPLKKSTGLPLSTAKIAVRLEGRAGFTHRRRAAESPCGRAQAHQPRTTFFSLLSTLYLPHSWFYYLPFRVFRVFRGFLPPTSGDARRNRRAGAPKRANHALPSSPYPLIPTYAILGYPRPFLCT